MKMGGGVHLRINHRKFRLLVRENRQFLKMTKTECYAATLQHEILSR